MRVGYLIGDGQANVGFYGRLVGDVQVDLKEAVVAQWLGTCLWC